MGYWRTSQAGESLQLEETGLIWGDQPADMIDVGIERLIGRLYLEKRRLPSVKELDALKFAADKPKELAFAIEQAAKVFAEDVGREPAPEEILAGLNFASSEVALDAFTRIHGGGMRHNGLLRRLWRRWVAFWIGDEPPHAPESQLDRWDRLGGPENRE